MYELVSVREHVRWQKILDLFNFSDIYYTAQYFLSAIKLDPGEPLLFYYEDKDGKVAYPFIKRSIDEEDTTYFDITTPYGYGGPLLDVKGEAVNLIGNFRKAFTKFCLEEKIIAELIRFHPLNNNASFFKDYLTLYPIYTTYTMNLKKTDKKVVNKNDSSNALNSSPIVIKKLGTVRHMFDFLVLYYSTARKREEADSYYFFTNDYFEALVSSIGPNLHLFGAYHNEKLVSACYVLALGDTIYQHCEGDNANQEAEGAWKLLLSTIAEWGGIIASLPFT
ncbi:GNAT family N-acetyltransferase [Planomicrobium sp. CPCC 101110]|uniref:GNAT family N-acetyltransferase n=1 Tax=Planomicrobium sp. CPCC 101110 TaxID=2599619 RepID=UPI0021043E41|nr:GNAT family N-acetyltransferase [Planomicrobium sp. CPCC 101110]